MTFPSTHPALARTLAARDYTQPTAVQLAVIEANATGRDLLVSAQTGSGKTVAFGLAMGATLLGEAQHFEQAAEPLALIIAPTRELAQQVQRELAWLYAETGARVISCVGGMDARAEARQLAQGAHLVVGTPGRLRDHLERNRLDLGKLRVAVLDEADEMLDLGFREDLEFILDATAKERRTLLFSATIPREIEALARSYQNDAVRIETARKDEQHADIEYTAVRVAPKDVENAVVNVLRFHEMRATLVFCATREAVKRMHARLVERGFAAVALSGELTQNERTQALLALRDGRARVLVATDVAARGLDLPDLALVIHADLPNDKETLLHRSGRTGRAGKKGLCVVVVPFNKRRKADILLNGARLRVAWGTAPSADAIRARDQERFLGDAIFTETPTELDQALAKTWQAGRTADEIALALVRMHRARLPEPEDLAEDTGPPRREDRVRPARERYERPENNASDSSYGSGSNGSGSRPFERAPARFAEGSENSTPPRSPRRPREDNRPMVWFRLNIGRERNADPRWLLPLICKAGSITKSEIGAITIFDKDTRFQIVADRADEFAEAARTNKQKEGHISRVGSYTPGDDAAVAEAIDALTAPAPSAMAAPAAPGNSPSDKPASMAQADRVTRETLAAPEAKAHAEKPYVTRPHKAKTSEKKPYAKPFERRPRDDRPSEGKPFERKPYERKPYKGRPSLGDAPAATPIAGKPHETPPHETRPHETRPDRRPHREKPSFSKPAGDAARAKPSWRDRKAAGYGKRPEPPKAPIAQATRADIHGKPRDASKYAHKKKHRQETAAE